MDARNICYVEKLWNMICDDIYAVKDIFPIVYASKLENVVRVLVRTYVYASRLTVVMDFLYQVQD